MMKTFDYSPLWETMKSRNITTYKLIREYGISSRTVNNLKHNKSITIFTLVRLCEILDCKADNVVKIYDETDVSSNKV